MLKKINEAKIEEFMWVIPAQVLEDQLRKEYGKNEVKKFNDFMRGQTMMVLDSQSGIYSCDLRRYLEYRKRGMKKNFPLDD